MANQKQYFEAKDAIYSTVMKVAKEQDLNTLQLISLLSSITSEVADIQRKEEERKQKEYNLIGKRVQVNVGNDKWGEVIVPGVPHLVTCEVEGGYGLSPIMSDFSDEELVAKRYHKFVVSKTDVELWKTTTCERFMNPERLKTPDIDIDVK